MHRKMNIKTHISRYKNELCIAALVLIDLGVAVIFGLSQSIYAPTTHMDGAFQTASGLFRLSNGQYPGKDFFPYLGVGLLFFLYPFFRIMGTNLAASVFSAWFVSAGTTTFGIGLIASLSRKSNRLLIPVLLSTCFLCITLLLYPGLPFDMATRVTPGNSLRPLRSFAPYLCAALAFLLLHSKVSPLRKFYTLPLIAAIGFLWSNDYGLPSFAAIMLFAWVFALRHHVLTLRTAALNSAIAVLCPLAMLTLATEGYPFKLLDYSFIGVARDQYWFFAGWSPTSHIFSLQDFYTKVWHPAIKWWGLMPLPIALLALIGRSYKLALLLLIGMVLFLGGALADVGGHLDYGYTESFVFWCRATFAMLLFNGLIEGFFFITKRVALPQRLKSWIYGLSLCVAISLTGLFAVYYGNQYLTKLKAAETDQEAYFVPELGGYLPKAWKSHIDMALAAKDKPVVEEYWGLWSSVIHNRGLLPADSIIHILGYKTRGMAAEVMDFLPETVISSTPGIAYYWLGWNVSASWWFYKELFEFYSPSQTSPTTFVWHRTGQQPVWPTYGCNILRNNGAPMIEVDTPDVGYYEITLHYDASKLRTRTIFTVQNNLNFADYYDGYLSLDPNVKTSIFPAALLDPRDKKLKFRLVTVKDRLSKAVISDCSAKKILFQQDAILPAPVPPSGSLHTVNLLDDEWVFGVARSQHSLLVDDNESTRKLLVPGVTLALADGWSRRIIQQEIKAPYLVLTLDKQAIDGMAGYPHVFTVQN